MYFEKDIVKEGADVLKQIAKPVQLPISKTDLNTLRNLHEYVVVSHIDELVAQYKIRPGVGIAAPQVGVSKRMFAIEFDDFMNDNEHYSMCVVNPVILRRSHEMTYLPGGEGCLSVDRETCGITPRNYRITVKAYLYDFTKNKMTLRTFDLEGYPAIVFQHEYDHLDGIMFVDKIYDEKKYLEENENAHPLYVIEENDDQES